MDKWVVQMTARKTKVFYYLDDYFHFDNLIDRLDVSKVDVYSLLGSYGRMKAFKKGLFTSYENKKIEEDFFQCGRYYDFDLSFSIESYFKQHTKEIFEQIQEEDDVVFLIEDIDAQLRFYDLFREYKKQFPYHFHVCALGNYDVREGVTDGMARIFPYYFEVDSIHIYNEKDLIEAGSGETDRRTARQLLIEQMMQDVNSIHFSLYHSDRDHIWFYQDGYKEYKVDVTVACNAVKEHHDLHEVIPRWEQPDQCCDRFRKLRRAYVHKHRIRGWAKEKECTHRQICTGPCPYCEQMAYALVDRNPEEQPQRAPNPYARITGIMRFREDIDGPGIRSLVLFDRCEMHCAYCLNKATVNILPVTEMISVKELTDHLKKDRVYQDVSGGGITFGGGEPLLEADFIKAVHTMYPHWDIGIETSFHVKTEAVALLLPFVSFWYVDIKDMNPDIYLAYTGMTNSLVIRNLKFVVAQGYQDRLVVRVPHIPNYNTAEDVNRSKQMLLKMGITHIDEFDYKVVLS